MNQLSQASESASHIATSKCDALSRELQENQERAADCRNDLERRLRNLQEQIHSLQEENEDIRNEKETTERHCKHAIEELNAKHEPIQVAVEELREDRDEKAMSLHNVLQKLARKEESMNNLEGEILRFKAQIGDADTIAVVKRELSDQVTHVKKLESQNRDQRIGLRQYQTQQKSIDVVEEEKRNLESKVSAMNDLRKELSETQLQRQILEDERKAWSSYLEKQTPLEEDEGYNFQSPEDLAKAFFQLRLERLSLVDQIGKVGPELTSRDETINELEAKLSQLSSDLENSRTALASAENTNAANSVEAKTKARLERQRLLAMKEVEYLRAQLKAFEAEENESSPEKHDAQNSQRIQELENLVDQYRGEIATLVSDIEKTIRSTISEPKTGSKRPRLANDDAENEFQVITTPRANELSSTNRKLQGELEQNKTQRAMLQKELESAKSQLRSTKSFSRTRILELRSNPTAEHAAVKQATLVHLREENEALLSQLSSLPPNSSVQSSQDDDNTPALAASNKSERALKATLTRLQDDVAAKDQHIASEATKTLRLKQKWKSISRQFREAVASILGWKLEVMPNGRVRVSSLFDPEGKGSRRGIREDGEDEEIMEANSIVFDGVAGTMKVSGGPKSKFEGEIRPLIEYWVDGRKEVPCFLAALTLELWEKGQGTMTAAR